MSAKARKKSRNTGAKKGFRREKGPTPNHKVRDKKEHVS